MLLRIQRSEVLEINLCRSVSHSGNRCSNTIHQRFQSGLCPTLVPSVCGRLHTPLDDRCDAGPSQNDRKHRLQLSGEHQLQRPRLFASTIPLRVRLRLGWNQKRIDGHELYNVFSSGGRNIPLLRLLPHPKKRPLAQGIKAR